MATVVLLDRMDENVRPEYCTHGRVQCYLCMNWCWLGDKTAELVRSGTVVPMCITCAEAHHEEMMQGRFTGNVQDHLRKDGPHEPTVQPKDAVDDG